MSRSTDVADPARHPCAVCSKQSHCESWEHRFCYPCFAELDRVLPVATGAADDRYRAFVVRWVAAKRTRPAITPPDPSPSEPTR